MRIDMTRYDAAARLIGRLAVLALVPLLFFCVTRTVVHAQSVATLAVPDAPSAGKPESTPRIFTGALFTTREQRDRLDRARSRRAMPEDEAVAETEPTQSVINGFVKRSDGRDTVWVDDVMKRDPRQELVQQLEPNVVGGITHGVAKPVFTNANVETKITGRKVLTKYRATKNKKRGNVLFPARKSRQK